MQQTVSVTSGEPPKKAPKVAIFAIHGISPIQRYAFGDQFADGLLAALNSGSQTWKPTAYWPPTKPIPDVDAGALRARAMRLYRAGEEDPENPRGPIFDVYEGYWSPLSKRKTNAASLLAWLLSCTLLAASATANIPAKAKKLWWDLGYVAALFVGALLLAVLALVMAYFGLQHFARAFDIAGATVSGLASNPLATVLAWPWPAYLLFALEVLIAYLLIEVVVLWRSSSKRASARRRLQAKALKSDSHLSDQIVRAAVWHRWAIALGLSVVALLLIGAVWLAVTQTKFPEEALFSGLLLVAGAGTLRLGRSALDFVVENVLGDVQVYTTSDTTAAFYAIREAIIELVAGSLGAVLRAEDSPGQALYDRVHVVAHSLGSTIGMDALIRLRQMCEEKAISPQQWSTIRSFVTFGTALEKTRFFFAVRHPTPTAAYDQFQNDLYGSLFTQERSTLDEENNDKGIYWANLWYPRDIVANEISSYQSDVPAGAPLSQWSGTARPICQNHPLPSLWPRFAFIHGNYTGDSRFWQEVTPILTGRTPP